MPDLDELTPGQVLADASVAEFIGTLGLSIAEAQKKLDENSVSQIAEFVAPRDGLNGKSLMELGLSPAFYHYQHADLSCSMNLSLRVEEGFSVGGRAEGSFSNNSTTGANETSSSSSSSSGSSTSTRERTASVNVESQSTGSLTISGENFTLAGDDPFTRIRALQTAITSNPAAGVPRVLYQPGDNSFSISSTAPTSRVVTTSNTVAFQGNFDRVIIRIDSNTNTDYVTNTSTTATTTSQADLSAYAEHVRATMTDLGYNTFMLSDTDPMARLHFRTGEHHLAEFSSGGTAFNEDFARQLIHKAGFIKENNLQVTVQGFADAQPFKEQTPSGSTNSNINLGNLRAKEIVRCLIANGVPAGNITTLASTGSTDAITAGGVADNIQFRKADLRITGRTGHWLFIESTTNALDIAEANLSPDERTTPLGSGNGFIYLMKPDKISLAGQTVTIEGTEFNLSGAPGGSHATGTPSAHAHNLKTAINANSSVSFSASSDGNVVTIFGDTTPFALTLFTAETRQIQMTSSSGVTVSRQFTRTQSASSSNQSTGNQAVAIGASIDARFSRQFEMSVTGNSAISARLVSIPAPPQFLETLQEFLNDNSG